MLENISLQKQHKRPFYQRENIIDHIVNLYVEKLKSTGMQNLKIVTAVDKAKDSIYKYPIIVPPLNDEEYGTNLETLINYSKIILKEKHINTEGKEIKIVIAEKPTRPFKQLNEKQFMPKEILIFETPYKPINP